MADFLGHLIVYGIMFFVAWLGYTITERRNATGEDNR